MNKIKKLLDNKVALFGVLVIASIIIVILVGTKTICFHSWVEATCTEPITCEKCKRTKGEPLGHNYTEATCTDPAKCKRCGTIKEQPLGHNVPKWDVTLKATCTKPGKAIGKCARCHTQQEKSTEPKGHKWGKWKVTKAATCTKEGQKQHQCSQCGKVATVRTDATGHRWTKWEIVKRATFSASGKKVCSCKNCGKRVSRKIPHLDREKVTAELEERFPSFDAVLAMEEYGQMQYPYGFKVHSVLGKIAAYAYNRNTWFVKYTVTITNAFGAEYDTVVEARVTGTPENPKIKYFYVYN